jgi:hypothetical protein
MEPNKEHGYCILHPVKMRDAHLEKTTFLYFNKTKKPYDKHFDPDYMLFEDINAQLDSVIIGEPWFGAKLKNISLKERSGLTVVDGSLKTVIDRKHMLFTDMRLKTPKSEIGDQVELRYNRMRDFVDLYHKVIFDFRLSKSVLDLEELNAFHDWFDGRSLSTFVNGRAVGTLAKMDVSSILLESLTDQTRIKASGSLSNLHDLDNFEYRLDLTDARVALSDLKQVVYELDSIAAIESVEAADISGQLSGSLNDVTFDGDLDDYQRYLLDEGKRLRAEAVAAANEAVQHAAASTAAQAQAAQVVQPAEAKPAIVPREQRKDDAQQRKLINEKKRPLKKEQDSVEAQMAKLEAEKTALHDKLATPLSPADIAEAGKRLKVVEDELATLELSWLQLTEAMEAIEAEMA